MCLSKPKAPEPLPPIETVERREPDLKISAKKARDTKRGKSSSSGLNRFLIVPGSSGSGANVPE